MFVSSLYHNKAKDEKDKAKLNLKGLKSQKKKRNQDTTGMTRMYLLLLFFILPHFRSSCRKVKLLHSYHKKSSHLTVLLFELQPNSLLVINIYEYLFIYLNNVHP